MDLTREQRSQGRMVSIRQKQGQLLTAAEAEKTTCGGKDSEDAVKKKSKRYLRSRQEKKSFFKNISL